MKARLYLNSFLLFLGLFPTSFIAQFQKKQKLEIAVVSAVFYVNGEWITKTGNKLGKYDLTKMAYIPKIDTVILFHSGNFKSMEINGLTYNDLSIIFPNKKFESFYLYSGIGNKNRWYFTKGKSFKKSKEINNVDIIQVTNNVFKVTLPDFDASKEKYYFVTEPQSSDFCFWQGSFVLKDCEPTQPDDFSEITIDIDVLCENDSCDYLVEIQNLLQSKDEFRKNRKLVLVHGNIDFLPQGFSVGIRVDRLSQIINTIKALGFEIQILCEDELLLNPVCLPVLILRTNSELIKSLIPIDDD